MWVGKDDEIDGLDYSLIKLNEKEFDKKMCEEFPEIFQDRRKPMSETCMCWGFAVGKGWYPLLYKFCSQLQAIFKLTGIFIIADQVKEKLGGLRFYKHSASENIKIDNSDIKIWTSIIDELHYKAQNDSYRVCADCGKFMRHKQIHLDGWIYAQCSVCLKKNKNTPELANEVDKWMKENEEE